MSGSSWIDSSPGYWQTWSPSYVNITVGSGTVTARYTQIGKTVHAYFKFVLGAGSAIGTTPTISVPVTAASQYGANVNQVGFGYAEDVGNAGYDIIFSLASTTVATLYTAGSAGAVTNNTTGVTATAPFTWGSGDYFNCTFTYEAA